MKNVVGSRIPNVCLLAASSYEKGMISIYISRGTFQRLFSALVIFTLKISWLLFELYMTSGVNCVKNLT